MSVSGVVLLPHCFGLRSLSFCPEFAPLLPRMFLVRLSVAVPGPFSPGRDAHIPQGRAVMEPRPRALPSENRRLTQVTSSDSGVSILNMLIWKAQAFFLLGFLNSNDGNLGLPLAIVFVS